MRVRRCFAVLFAPRERVDFELAGLLGGSTGVSVSRELVALAAHCDAEIAVSVEEIAALGAISPEHWVEQEVIADQYTPELRDGLLHKHLLVAETGGGDAARRDQTLRDIHWRSLDAVTHRHSRWSKVDTVAAQRRFDEETDQTFLDRLGPAPAEVCAHVPAEQRVSLVRPGDSALDGLLGRRVTCRNYDTSRFLSQADFGAVLFRTFGARTVDEYAPGIFLLKKGVPSAGGLHPVEAYVLVQRVEGIDPGLYHYHPVAHALEPIETMTPEQLSALALRCLGGQPYFSTAHAIIVLTGRFGRNFWKYRSHAKAYRAVILDAGHLSQTLYLSATERNLGAFVTAGVNEVDIEAAFNLDPMQEGPLAMCGFGIRDATRKEVEFDPLHAVWPKH